MYRLRESLPFENNQEVKVPTIIHPSGKATIVGNEWGLNNKFLNYNGWVYYLSFPGGGEAWTATEAELVEWQK